MLRNGGFSVALSLRLPRDQMSVPIARHLTEKALHEMGADTRDVQDVELALTEACGNVLKHAGPGDVYDVDVTIGPTECLVRIVDLGRGFDTGAADRDMASKDAEGGRGMGLMHALMDQVRFVSEPDNGTAVHLVKRLRFDPDAPARRLGSPDAEQVRPTTKR